MALKINIIRGQNQIGGSIIELYTESTRIILDVGMNLGENKLHTSVPDVPGLFKGYPIYDAIFVSHYHSDHMGLLKYVLPEIPVYMGRTAYRVAHALNKHQGGKLGFRPEFLDAEKPVTVGDITVTPIPCDHSAYGSFMFLVSSGGKTVLYSADFRSTGRSNFDALLETLPEVDVLITEGTTLSRGLDFHEPSEQELEDFAVNTLQAHKGPAVVYLSAQNVERIITAYNASKRVGRRFIMDDLTSTVAEAAGLDFDAYVLKPSHSFADLGEIVATSMRGSESGPYPAVSDKKAFSSPDFLLCLTPQSLINFRKVAQRSSFKDSVLFFARRETHMLKPAAAAFIAFMESLGAVVPTLHTSGHADSNTIDRLIHDVRPSVIIPVHTELASWFARYEDECEVIYDCHDYEV